MSAESISLHQDGTKFHLPTVPTQGSITSTTTRIPIKDVSRSAENMSAQQPQVKQLEQKRFVKRYRTEVAASASSVLSTLATFPLDSVKTRMQTYKYSGFIGCVRHTYETEKLRGFFRGKSTSGVPVCEAFDKSKRSHMTNHRRDCSARKHHSRANRFILDLPTFQIPLLGLAEEKFRHRCARSCQQEGDLSQSGVDCLFRCGGCYRWVLYYLDRM